MKIIFFDVETTGLLKPSGSPLDQQPYIIEIGAISYDSETKETKELSQLIKPPIQIPLKITKITGIKDEDVKDALKFQDFSSTLHHFFDGIDILVSHNVHFDSECLRYELERGCKTVQGDFDLLRNFPKPKKMLCTANESIVEFGYRPKLTELYQKIFDKKLNQTHRALDDARALMEIVMRKEMINIEN